MCRAIGSEGTVLALGEKGRLQHRVGRANYFADLCLEEVASDSLCVVFSFSTRNNGWTIRAGREAPSGSVPFPVANGAVVRFWRNNELVAQLKLTINQGQAELRPHINQPDAAYAHLAAVAV